MKLEKQLRKILGIDSELLRAAVTTGPDTREGARAATRIASLIISQSLGSTPLITALLRRVAVGSARSSENRFRRNCIARSVAPAYTSSSFRVGSCTGFAASARQLRECHQH
jgi:hypothetical protein